MEAENEAATLITIEETVVEEIIANDAETGDDADNLLDVTETDEIIIQINDGNDTGEENSM